MPTSTPGPTPAPATTTRELLYAAGLRRFARDGWRTARVRDIVAEPRRVANRIVEECMITANVCAALVLRERLGFGIYNTHTGFDPALVEQAVSLLAANDVAANAEALLTLEGFCTLRRHLDSLPSTFLDSRIRRFQTFAEISTEPGPHFGLGLEAYATWTSPIRKYGDMVNHRLLKALIANQPTTRPDAALTLQLAERLGAETRTLRAERDVAAAFRELGATPGRAGYQRVAAAWQVSERTGAPIAVVLGRVAENLREERHLAAVVSAELATARASGRIMAALPFVAIGMGSLVGAKPLEFLFGSWLGQAAFMAGTVLVVGGVVWTERIARTGEKVGARR